MISPLYIVYPGRVYVNYKKAGDKILSNFISGYIFIVRSNMIVSLDAFNLSPHLQPYP